MPLHLIKPSVGTDSVADLEDWIKQKLKAQKQRGKTRARTRSVRRRIWLMPAFGVTADIAL